MAQNMRNCVEYIHHTVEHHRQTLYRQHIKLPIPCAVFDTLTNYKFSINDSIH